MLEDSQTFCINTLCNPYIHVLCFYSSSDMNRNCVHRARTVKFKEIITVYEKKLSWQIWYDRPKLPQYITLLWSEMKRICIEKHKVNIFRR